MHHDRIALDVLRMGGVQVLGGEVQALHVRVVFVRRQDLVLRGGVRCQLIRVVMGEGMRVVVVSGRHLRFVQLQPVMRVRVMMMVVRDRHLVVDGVRMHVRRRAHQVLEVRVMRHQRWQVVLQGHGSVVVQRLVVFHVLVVMVVAPLRRRRRQVHMRRWSQRIYPPKTVV